MSSLSGIYSSLLKQMREKLGMTQEQLAKRAGVTQSMIAEIESGKSNNLFIITIQKLAEALNCTAMIGLTPQKNLDAILDERSTKLALEIISATSGSTAIELQLPDKGFIDSQFQKTKEDILKYHRSALWQET